LIEYPAPFTVSPVAGSSIRKPLKSNPVGYNASGIALPEPFAGITIGAGGSASATDVAKLISSPLVAIAAKEPPPLELPEPKSTVFVCMKNVMFVLESAG
jgi:hypothetical protein